MRCWFGLLTFVFLSFTALSAQENCQQSDAPSIDTDWQTIQTHRITFRAPKDFLAVPIRCIDGGCYRFENSESFLTIDTDSAAGYPSQPTLNQKFLFVDDIPAWLWRRRDRGDEYKYVYGATYFSHADKNFRTTISISSKNEDIGEAAERIFLSAQVDSRLRSPADASAIRACNCLNAKRKPNAVVFSEIASRFLFTSRITLPADDLSRQLLAAIKARGFAGHLYPEDVNLLAKSGASDELINLLLALSSQEVADQTRLYMQVTDNYTARERAKMTKAVVAGREFLEKYWCYAGLVDHVSFVLIQVHRLEAQLRSLHGH